MRHLFRCTKQGYNAETEVIWFDADYYTEEEAWEQFTEFEDVTLQGYPYKGYEYNGERFYEVFYMGLFEDDDMPQNNYEFVDKIIDLLRE